MATHLQIKPISMFKNYFKTAWRNLTKTRFYTLVNIIGLATGIAFTLVIAAYVWGELQVNAGLKNARQQYIIQSKWKDPNMGYDLTSVGPLAKQLKERYPNLVANYYRWDGITSSISKGDKSFREGIQIGDSTIFSMYGFTLMHGNIATAFEEPYSVIISAEKAKKYFGKTDVVGQSLSIENFSGSRHDFLVAGVLDKAPKNSVTFLNDDNNNQIFISTNNLAYFGRNMDWLNTSIVSYVELQKGVLPQDLDKPMQYLLQQNAQAQIANNLTPYLVPLQKYYLQGNNGLVQKMITTLSLVAVFILLMAVVNFINMAVSRSATRMREIGIRKVLGGIKRQLVIQFLIESTLLVMVSTILAIIVYLLSRETFSTILGKPLPALTAFPLYFIFFLLLLIVAVGFLAGIYPAFVLSSLKTVESLKGKLGVVKDRVVFRKSLVAFQFATAIIVCISALIISQQVKLFFSQSLGYDKSYIVSAPLPRNWTPEVVRKMEQIRSEFAAMPEVSNLALSFEIPDGGNGGSVGLYKPGTDSATAIPSALLMTDEYYAATYNIPLEAGEFFSKPGAFTDSFTLVINEAQCQAQGWKTPHEAIGKQLKFQSGGQPFTIAGVTKNFHFSSMQQVIQPLTFLHVGVTNTFRLFSFKLKPGNIRQTMDVLQKKWAMLMPGTPFEYTFMDDSLKRVYKAELQLEKASYIATILSLIIVLLGVLGLISLSIQKRTKEIGIRKILGSSVQGIIGLFVKEFLLVIALSALIACPLAYFLMNGWLSDYVYRVNITVQPFILTLGVLGCITAILIILQTCKTALANPVKSLRSE